MASRLFFNGRQYTTPVTVSAVEDSAMSPRNPATGNNLAILGISEGGKPNTPLTFGSPQEAARVLRGGEGLKAVRKAFAPSAATGGPRKITFIRVGQPTRSSLTLKDAAAASSIVLTSDIYGIPANTLKVKVEAGSLRGKKLTTQLGNEYCTADNIFREAFTVAYAGTEATATIDVTDTSVVLKAPVATTLATISLDEFPTVQQLCDRISAVAGFTATPKAGSELNGTLNKLDGVTAGDVKAGTVTVTAHLQACIDWFNGAGENFVSAARAAGATAAPAAVPFTYMTGAAAPAPTVEDWTTALEVLQGVDVQWVVPLSGSATVQAATDAHVVFMSDVGGKERRAVVGCIAGTDVSGAISAAASLASDRTALAWPGHYELDDNEQLQLLPGYMTAVLVAAAFAGVNPGVALTNKTLRVQGLEFQARNPVDTDALIDGGVLAVEATQDGYKVVRSVSTWLANDNYNRVEMSCGAATDFIMRSVRERLDVLRGEQASPRSLSRAKAIAESALRALAVPAPAGPGVIVGDDANPAYSDVIATLDGDIINVAFQCQPVIPLNFVTLGVSIVPYAGTTAAA